MTAPDSCLLGTAERPLRVAIVGSGPAGFYTAGALFHQNGVHLRVDMFERVAMPYGLVRYGVAPDHQRIKRVVRSFEATARDPRFRFFGNVDVGRDLPVRVLRDHYDQIVYAFGCSVDRRLGIPGEDLPGSHTARVFVGWYNAHPEHCRRRFDLTGRRVAVVGAGNVALDVTRMLVKDPEELASTDIADYALDALRESRVKEVLILGRRGPAQARFTTREIRAIGSLPDVDLVVRPEGLPPDQPSCSRLEKRGPAHGNLRYLAERMRLGPQGAARRVVLRFLASPRELIAIGGRVGAIRVERNRLVVDEQGNTRPVGTGISDVVPVDLVLRSVGYRGVRLPGVPFDDRKGVIPSAAGRVLRGPGPANGTGEYVAGWIKRGPVGLIGANRKDSAETVGSMMEDIRGRKARPAPENADHAVRRFLLRRGVRPTSFLDWNAIDRAEQERGRRQGKPREKVVDPADVSSLLDRRRHPAPAP